MGWRRQCLISTKLHDCLLTLDQENGKGTRLERVNSQNSCRSYPAVRHHTHLPPLIKALNQKATVASSSSMPKTLRFSPNSMRGWKTGIEAVGDRPVRVERSQSVVHHTPVFWGKCIQGARRYGPRHCLGLNKLPTSRGRNAC